VPLAYTPGVMVAQATAPSQTAGAFDLAGLKFDAEGAIALKGVLGPRDKVADGAVLIGAVGGAVAQARGASVGITRTPFVRCDRAHMWRRRTRPPQKPPAGCPWRRRAGRLAIYR
jgi:hypothetical protein